MQRFTVRMIAAIEKTLNAAQYLKCDVNTDCPPHMSLVSASAPALIAAQHPNETPDVISYPQHGGRTSAIALPKPSPA